MASLLAVFSGIHWMAIYSKIVLKIVLNLTDSRARFHRFHVAHAGEDVVGGVTRVDVSRPE